MFKIFLGSVSTLWGMMGADLRTAQKLRITLGSFALKPKPFSQLTMSYPLLLSLHYKIMLLFVFSLATLTGNISTVAAFIFLLHSVTFLSFLDLLLIAKEVA